MGMWNILADLGAWEQISGQIENELKNSLCPVETVYSIIAAADEIFANISAYAYPEKEGQVEIQTINMKIGNGQNEYQLIFSDWGIKFNPLEVQTYENIAHRKYQSSIKGGFGIHIIRDKADKLSYKYENGQNILCFTKFYESTTK